VIHWRLLRALILISFVALYAATADPNPAKDTATARKMTPQELSQKAHIDSLIREKNAVAGNVDLWSTLYLWSLVIAIFIGGFSVIAQFKAIRFSKRLVSIEEQINREKDRQSAADSIEKNERIAELTLRSKEAESRIAGANQTSAEAGERAAIAQQRAGELENDLAATLMRLSTSEQALVATRLFQAPRGGETFGLLRFVGALEKHPKGTAEILYQAEDGEAYDLASVLHKGLSVAGWMAMGPLPIPASSSGQPSIIEIGAAVRGVTVLACSGSPLYAALWTALNGHVVVFPKLDPRLPADRLRIVVGPKP